MPVLQHVAPSEWLRAALRKFDPELARDLLKSPIDPFNYFVNKRPNSDCKKRDSVLPKRPPF